MLTWTEIGILQVAQITIEAQNIYFTYSMRKCITTGRIVLVLAVKEYKNYTNLSWVLFRFCKLLLQFNIFWSTFLTARDNTTLFGELP